MEDNLLRSKHFSVKVIIFPEALLSPETIQRLHDLGCKYDEWLKILIEKKRAANKTYGEQFYLNNEIERYVNFSMFNPSALKFYIYFRNNSKSIRLDCEDMLEDQKLEDQKLESLQLESGDKQEDCELDRGKMQNDRGLNSGVEQGDHSGDRQGGHRLDRSVMCAESDVDHSTSEEQMSQLMCENIYCQDYLVFKCPAHKARHDR